MFPKCKKCGMTLDTKQDFHPNAACVMFRQTGQSEKVEDALLGIIRYGMWAEEAGMTSLQALRESTSMHQADTE